MNTIKKITLLVIAMMAFTTMAGVIRNPVILESTNFPYSKKEVGLFSLGNWKGTIQLAPVHSQESMDLAFVLQAELMRMGGTNPIPIVAQSGGQGFKLGTYDEWIPVLPSADNPYLNANDDYILISIGGTMRILGKDHETLERAVWHFLHILGYRQYMPTDTWEIVPKAVNAFNVNIGYVGNKVFAHNGILGGLKSANFMETKDLINEWMKKNRLSTAFSMDDHQMWQKIVGENSDEFLANPHYSSSEGNKLCVFQPDVQNFAIDYIKDEILSKPDKDVHSITAPDGSIGWDEPCESGGPIEEGGTGENEVSPSDRQIFLANIVQGAIRHEALTNPLFAGKTVNFLAYGDTSNVPTYTLDPDIHVSVATAFVMDGQTPAQVAAEYRAVGAVNIGCYGYFGTQLWGSGIPTMSKLANQLVWADAFNEIKGVVEGSPQPYNTGESSSAWGLFGPGFYVFSKLFVDPEADSSNVESKIAEHYNEFIDTAFGTASVPMKEFFDMVTAGDGVIKILSPNLIHEMYDRLAQARELIDVQVDLDIRDRINELVYYTRILELQYITETAQKGSPERLDAYDNFMQFIYEVRESLMYDYYNVFFDPTFSDMKDALAARHGLPTLTPYTVRNSSNWDAVPPDDTEVATIIEEGLENNQPYPFTPVSFGIADLAVTNFFDSDTRGRAGEGGQDQYMDLSGTHNWYLKTKVGQTSFTFTGMAGSGTTQQPHPNGPARIDLYQVDIANDSEDFVESVEIISDNYTETEYTFENLLEDALYRIDVIDPSVLVQLKWDKEEYKIVHVLKEDGNYYLRKNYGYFYVPKANNTIGFYLGKTGSRIFKPDDTVAYESLTDYEYVSLDIDDPNDKGQIWKIHCQGSDHPNQGCYLYNVPPQVARSPRELLIQQSLIEEDDLKIE